MSNIILTPIQNEALRFIYDAFDRNINPICALGPGLGKTFVSCELIRHFIDNNKENYRIFIIHKASNYNTPWKKSLEEYFSKNIKNDTSSNKMKFFYIHGKEREKLILNGKYIFPKKYIYLTSYETLSIDIENGLYKTGDKYDLLIFDELHTIVNSKRLTKRTKNIYSLNTKNKIALTASPIQNKNEEIGLEFIFLNDIKGFTNLIDLYQSVLKTDSYELKKPIIRNIENILDANIELCKVNYAVFHYDEEKTKFKKTANILSLPIDEIMLNKFEDMYKEPLPTKRMFLSHPESIYRRDNSFILPRCTKADAVKIILDNMHENEKAIIFSLNIDVLLAYAKLCNTLGFSAMKITANDKGIKLTKKINEFRNSKKCRVLLTTVPKSAEGFNYEFVNHIIILEFWWNPQKIIQAMSRIDRITQTCNIFIFILCYNNKGEMLEYEKMYYVKMIDKLNNA
jgi:superfamily II DNA or RNA helicase